MNFEQEQIGTIQCCEEDMKIDPEHPYNPKMEHKFDKEVYIAAGAVTNVSMFFNMPALSEEIWDLFLTEYMTPQNGYEVELMLAGYAHMKSARWGFDLGVYTDCMVHANTSRMVTSNSNAWPPKLYHYQKFPIRHASCKYSLTSIKYIAQ